MAWPCDFRMAPPTASAAPKFWSHELYRGPKKQSVKLLYSRTKMESEEIAHEFLEETVLGFDMEWPWQNQNQSDVPLQQRVGLIQLASEDKVALFHIGLHAGQTAKDILAPALRKIIESDKITKTGVGILNADFARLHRWFGLKPRGAFELSHLHHLITYGPECPIMVTTKMKALSKLVEIHLGLPLFKGKVRTSNWSRPLNRAQISYAAADAYAGVMLYHCMNAKRLAMDPAPPLPLHAETYLPMTPGMGSIVPVQLGSSSKDPSGISAVEFYQQSQMREEPASFIEAQEDKDVQSEDEEQREVEVLEDVDAVRLGGPSAVERQVTSPTKEDVDLVVVGRRGRHILLEQGEVGASIKAPESRRPERPGQMRSLKTASESRENPEGGQVSQPALGSPESTQALYARLSAHRKRIADERKCALFIVAHNKLLSAISERRPRNEQELRQIRGVGKGKATTYGPAWLAIVHEFLEEQSAVVLHDEEEMTSPAALSMMATSRRTRAAEAVNETSGGHMKTPAVLHTGLSFNLDNATLEAESDQAIIEISDDSSAFESLLSSPTSSTLKRKRGLLTSSTEIQHEQRPVLPPPIFHSKRTVANATQQPDLQEITPSTVDVEEMISSNMESAHTPLPRPQHAALKQMLSPRVLPRGAAPMPKSQAAVEGQILRNKLLAFNRRVTAMVVLSEATIEQIVQNPPKTTQELVQIPDIMPFANACARQNQCLLTFILKSTPKPASTYLEQG